LASASIFGAQDTIDKKDVRIKILFIGLSVYWLQIQYTSNFSESIAC
jgi:hypothetical protein